MGTPEWRRLIEEKLADDSELAHGWHDNVACCIMDEGIPHGAANRAASRVMAHLFGVTTSRPTTEGDS